MGDGFLRYHPFVPNGMRRVGTERICVFWLGLLAFGAAGLMALLALLHWVFTDPAPKRDDTIARFHAEQEYRAERRAGKLTSR